MEFRVLKKWIVANKIKTSYHFENESRGFFKFSGVNVINEVKIILLLFVPSSLDKLSKFVDFTVHHTVDVAGFIQYERLY
jgi:hypothetical protein